jgi:hypothetical protein
VRNLIWQRNVPAAEPPPPSLAHESWPRNTPGADRMGLGRSLALPVAPKAFGGAVTSPPFSSIWRISRYLLSCRKPLRPSHLSRNPAPGFSPLQHSVFCLAPRKLSGLPSAFVSTCARDPLTVRVKLLTHGRQFGGKR